MGGGTFEIDVDERAVAPGGTVSGVVRVVDAGPVRGVSVELGRTETSTGSLPPAFLVSATVHLPDAPEAAAGTAIPFALVLPADAVPAFTAPHGAVAWAVRVRTGRLGASTVARPVTVAGPWPGVSEQHVEELGAAAMAKSQADRPDNRRLGWVFAGIGVVFVVLGAYWSANPPASWEDQGGGGVALGMCFGMGALLIVCGALVLRSQVARPIEPLELTVQRGAVRPGSAVRVSATNGTDRPLAVGLESVEVVQRRTQARSSSVVYHREFVLASQWRPLAAGVSTVEFTVPAESISTYVGERVTIAHRVSVVPAGKERSRRNRSARRVPVVVVP